MTRPRPPFTVAITGVDGFLGSRLSDHLARTFQIIKLDRQSLDLTCELEVARVVAGLAPDVLINVAAIADTGLCERDPAASYPVNVAGPLHLARACARAGAKLIHLSSDQVFNGNEEFGPYDETTPPRPDTVYGAQKLEAEGRVMEAAPASVILRLTWLFDFPMRLKPTNDNIAWNVLRAALLTRPLSLPVNEYRGMTYVHDLVERFDGMLELPPGVYHAGSANDFSTYETGALVLETLGLGHRSPEILSKDTAKYCAHPRDLRVTCDRLARHGIVFPTTAEAIGRSVREHLAGL